LLHDAGQFAAPFDTAEGRAAPDTAGNELERPRADFRARRGDPSAVDYRAVVARAYGEQPDDCPPSDADAGDDDCDTDRREVTP